MIRTYNLVTFFIILVAFLNNLVIIPKILVTFLNNFATQH